MVSNTHMSGGGILVEEGQDTGVVKWSNLDERIDSFKGNFGRREAQKRKDDENLTADGKK